MDSLRRICLRCYREETSLALYIHLMQPIFRCSARALVFAPDISIGRLLLCVERRKKGERERERKDECVEWRACGQTEAVPDCSRVSGGITTDFFPWIVQRAFRAGLDCGWTGSMGFVLGLTLFVCTLKDVGGFEEHWVTWRNSKNKKKKKKELKKNNVKYWYVGDYLILYRLRYPLKVDEQCGSRLLALRIKEQIIFFIILIFVWKDYKITCNLWGGNNFVYLFILVTKAFQVGNGFGYNSS